MFSGTYWAALVVFSDASPTPLVQDIGTPYTVKGECCNHYSRSQTVEVCDKSHLLKSVTFTELQLTM